MTVRETSFDTNQATELEQAQQVASSLDNLANTSIQKNATINNLVATNAMLNKATADIQLSIARMCTARVPIPPTPTFPTPPMVDHVHSLHWSPTKPARDKHGYCWLHDYKVGHNSSTCSLHKTGHCENV